MSSQGAESRMVAVLKNQIRFLEPHKVLQGVTRSHRSSFLAKRKASKICTSPVSPYVGKYLATCFVKSRIHQQTVHFLEETAHREATVRSMKYGSILLCVSISGIGHISPS